MDGFETEGQECFYYLKNTQTEAVMIFQGGGDLRKCLPSVVILPYFSSLRSHIETFSITDVVKKIKCFP